MVIQAVLFDFDGTLTLPGALDFAAIRQAVSCPAGRPILEFIHAIRDPRERRAALDKLDTMELRAAGRSKPNAGSQELIGWLKSNGFGLGIITRNSRQSVLRALENFNTVEPADFNLIITRDDPVRPKPSGEGIQQAAGMWRLPPRQILVVGDFVFDCLAGRAAGAPTVLLDAFCDPRLQEVDCDYRISGLNELKKILEIDGSPRS